MVATIDGFHYTWGLGLSFFGERTNFSLPNITIIILLCTVTLTCYCVFIFIQGQNGTEGMKGDQGMPGMIEGIHFKISVRPNFS